MSRTFNPTKFRSSVCVALKRMGDASSPASDDEMMDNYIRGLRVVAGRELNSKALRKELIALYQCRLIPYFDLRTARRLLDRRKACPRYLVNLVLFVKTLKIKFETVPALLQIYTIFDSNESPKIFRARMIFLRMVLDKLEDNTMENEGLRKLLNAIGQARIERQSAEVILQGLENHPAHGLNTLFHWLDDASAKGQTAEEFLKIINFCNGVLIGFPWAVQNVFYQGGSIKYGPTIPLGPTVLCLTPQLRSFISIIEKTTDLQIPLEFRRMGFENLYALYILNPVLFERLAPFCAGAGNGYSYCTAYMEAAQMNQKLAQLYWGRQISKKLFQWFKCLYQGKGLVGRKDLPVTMTRKAVHRFRTLKACNDLTVRQQLVLAQVMQTGVDDMRYATFVVDGMGPRRKADYLIEAMHNLYKRGLPADEVRYIMDYLKAKFDDARVNVKEKQMATLIRDAERWHDQMNQLREARWGDFDYYWEKTTDFRLKSSEIEDRFFDHDGVEYVVRQLVRAKDLVREGDAMSHCIASYAHDCRYGHTFIFALRKMNGSEEHPLLTLEVRGWSLVQARGFGNRLPSELEFDVIRLWASYEDVQLRL